MDNESIGNRDISDSVKLVASCEMIPAGYPTQRRNATGERRDRSRLTFSTVGNYCEKILKIFRFAIAFQDAIGDKYTIAVTNNTDTKERNDERNNRSHEEV